MQILVIGGTGFIGPEVVRWLSDMGHRIALFHRGRTQSELPPGVEEILGDRRDAPAFAGRFRTLAPDVVLDLIPLTKADALTVTETFRGLAGRAVAISSQDVYRAYGRAIALEAGPPEPVPLDEDAPLRGHLYPYRGEQPRTAGDPRRWLDDYDKVLVERVVMGDPGLPGTILRLPMVYGPRDRQHRWFPYLKRMSDGRPAILLGQGLSAWRWTRGYVANVAGAIALAVHDPRAAGCIYNVGEEHAFSETEWVRALARVVGWDGEIVIVPDDRLPQHLIPGIDTTQHLVVDTTAIRRDLGYREPVTRDEALRRTVAWELANPPAEFDTRAFDYAAEDAVLAKRSH